jgi:hypothetical protein
VFASHLVLPVDIAAGVEQVCHAWVSPHMWRK